MAEALKFVCGNCHEAWSDGNPHYLTKRGVKKYAYHPDHEGLDKCIGNDRPYLCLDCGAEFNIDSAAPVFKCAKCGVKEIVDLFDLDGKKCPYCKAGVFGVDPEFHCIS